MLCDCVPNLISVCGRADSAVNLVSKACRVLLSSVLTEEPCRYKEHFLKEDQPITKGMTSAPVDSPKAYKGVPLTTELHFYFITIKTVTVKRCPTQTCVLCGPVLVRAHPLKTSALLG